MSRPEPTFQNREEELDIWLSGREPPRLLNLYGEAGIGKSRLLQEATRRLRRGPALVLFVDLAALPVRTAVRPEVLLRALVDQAGGLLRGFWRSPEQVAAEVVLQLSSLADTRPVYLFCDTTEAVQDDNVFWNWLEANLAGPLAVEGRVYQVYAGRVRAPWRRIEVRRFLQPCRLEPLPSITKESREPPIRELAAEVFRMAAPEGQPAHLAADLTARLAFGHPQLAQEIARYLGEQARVGRDLHGLELEKEVAEKVVDPFIEDLLFKGIQDEWKKLLRQASVLDWFDATVLETYLERVGLPLPVDWAAFFIRGMAELSRRYAVVEWDEQVGDYRLSGTVRDIVRCQLQTANPAGYQAALEAAAQAFEKIAEEYFSADEKESGRLKEQAAGYRKRDARR
jgi:hypothetical protein